MNAFTGPTRSSLPIRCAAPARARRPGRPAARYRHPQRSRRSASSRCHSLAAAAGLEVVDADDAARVRLRHAVAHAPASARAGVGSGSGNRHASHSWRMPVGVLDARARSAAELTHSVWWSCAHSAAGRSPVTASSAAAVGGRPATRRQPAVAAQPALAAARPRPPPQRLGQRLAAVQVELLAARAPSPGSARGVGEPGQHAAAVQVDPLVPDGVDLALAHVHAACDQRARRRPARAPAAGAGPSCRSGRCGGSSGRLVYARVVPADEIERRLRRLRQAIARGRAGRRGDRAEHRPGLPVGHQPAGAPAGAGARAAAAAGAAHARARPRGVAAGA